MMYESPEIYETTNYIHPVENNCIQACKQSEYSKAKSQYPCSKEMFDFCTVIMADESFLVPQNAEDALRLYLDIRPILRAYL